MRDRPEFRRSNIEAAAEKLLRKARMKPELLGADVLFRQARTWALSLLDGVPEENTYGESGGLSLRLIANDGRQGLAVTNDFSSGNLDELMEWSYNNCLASEKDEDISLYEGLPDYDDTSLELYDDMMEDFADAGFRMDTCLAMNETARSRDARVASVRSAAWNHGHIEMFYTSTAGLSFWKRGTTASCGVSVVLNDGEAFEIGAYGRVARFTEDLDAEEAARLAVDRTLMVLGGRSLPTGKYTLLLDPEISAALVDEIGEMFCASEVHKGRSLMAGKLGHRVAGSAFSLVDDSRIRRGIATSSCDLEGVPTGSILLIDKGVANAYLYNLQYAARDRVKSTGSASRGLSSLPDVGTSNLVLQPGNETPESLMKRVRRGFLVMELMGLHTINSVTGDFSLGARGVQIENGEPCGPVSGVTIADNLIGFLQKIKSVGNDLVFHGSTGAPTIVVEDVTLAGE